MDGAGHASHLTTVGSLGVQRQPGANDEGPGAVASDIDALAVQSRAVVVVQFVGEVTERGLIVHAAVVEVVHVLRFVHALRDEEVSKSGEAGGAVGIPMDDEKLLRHVNLRRRADMRRVN
jgi:hypothetical protein